MLTQKIAKQYKQFTSVLKVTGGELRRIDGYSYAIDASFKLTDCENRRKATIKKLYTFKVNGERLPGSVCCQSAPCGYQKLELAEATSNNGDYTARLVQGAAQGVDGEKNQILEIWENDADTSSVNLLKSIDLSKVEAHGRIILDEPFFSFRWDSSSQNKLLYTCLPKPSKPAPLFEELIGCSSKQAPENADQEFNRKEDWGETLEGIDHTVVGVLSVEDNFRITVIDMPDYSLANSQWLYGGDKIISEAYKETPRFGLVFCNNRPSIIVVHRPSTGEVLWDISREGVSFNTLRVNKDGTKYIVAETSTLGPHFLPSTLTLYLDHAESFRHQLTKEPLFLDCVPEQCFAPDNCGILFSYSKNLESYLTYLSFCTLTQSHIDTPCSTISAITYKHGFILICGSSIDQPPAMYLTLFRYTDEAKLITCAWIPIHKPNILNFIDYKLIEDIPTSDNKDEISAIVAKAKSVEASNNGLTVFVVHGGPCSSFVDQYYEYHAFLIKLGLNVIFINYRGSSGVDEEHLRKLTGKAGILDVEDCSEVIRYFIRAQLVDPNKLAVFGGSHGGFLTAHLCASGEFQFTSAVMLNPVLDFVSSLFTTDIPDWVVEVAIGDKYDPKWMPKCDQLLKMYTQSPLYNVGNSKVPTLMLLGSKDLRVKMYQGLRWIEHLKSKGVETSCKVYPDTHRLLNHPDSLVSAAAWLVKHAGDENLFNLSS